MTDTAVLDKPPAPTHDEPELPDMPPRPLADVPAKDRPPSPADDAKPRRARRRDRTPRAAAEPAKRGPGRPPKDRTAEVAAEFEKPLHDLFTTLGTIAMAVNPLDGLVIVDRAEANAKAVAKLAAENEAVANVIRRLSTGGAVGGALVALATTALPILANHGVAVPMGPQMLEPYKARARELGIELPPEPTQPDSGGAAGL